MRIGRFAQVGRKKATLADGQELRRACEASWRRDRLGLFRVPDEDSGDNLMAILRRLT